MKDLCLLPVDRRVIYRRNERFVWNGITSIEVRGDVILYSWYTGGEGEPRVENLVVFTRSLDGGETWEDLEIACDPPGSVRAADPTLWIDPQGNLRHWVCVNDTGREAGDWEVRERVSEDYCGAAVTWRPWRRVEAGLGDWLNINKPIVRSDGAWVYPAMVRTGPSGGRPYFEGFKCGAVVVSADGGETWTGYRTGEFQGSWVWEPMVFERDDGDIVMFIRTDVGQIFQARSADGGETWSPFSGTGLPNPNTRFHLRKLPGGPVIVLNNPSAKNWGERTPLALHVSRDDGESFRELYILDTDELFMYPDAALGGDGHTLHMSYENRRDIFYARCDLREVL